MIEKLKEFANDKMIAVAIAAFNTTGVVAEGMGKEFTKYGKSFASLFLTKTKDAKLVLPASTAMSKVRTLLE